MFLEEFIIFNNTYISHFGVYFYIIQGVLNWYLHFQMVITREQKIVQYGIICQKKAKSMLSYMI